VQGQGRGAWCQPPACVPTWCSMAALLELLCRACALLLCACTSCPSLQVPQSPFTHMSSHCTCQQLAACEEHVLWRVHGALPPLPLTLLVGLLLLGVVLRLMTLKTQCSSEMQE
jgi:hypothetical protein